VELGRFRTILNAYGATPERWPAEERDDALALTRTSVPAARALADARTFDEALEASTVSSLTVDPNHIAMLQARIVAAAQPTMQSWIGRWFGISLTPMQVWPSIAGLAMASVLGFAVGLGGVLQTESNRDADDGLVFSSVDLSIGGQ
jgi:hypothetical protein